MKQVAVVIPIYKRTPDWNEVISLRQTVKVLGRYPIVLVCPEGLNITIYEDMYAEANGDSHILRESFDKKYFVGIKGYNHLLLSECFYERFSGYEYILICQPDAYVFRDEIEKWCNKGFDYIGAPLFGSRMDLTNASVGNGGLSLRRVEAYLNYFNGNNHVIPIKNIASRIGFSAKPYTRWLVWLLMVLGWRNKPQQIAMQYKYNEDGFWSQYLNGTNYELYKPSPVEAADFAWERFPSELYAKLNHLPFGCHAWEKYEYDSFWKLYIEKC